MRINTSFSEFKKKHSKKKNQILFKSFKCNDYYKVELNQRTIDRVKNSF